MTHIGEAPSGRNDLKIVRQLENKQVRRLPVQEQRHPTVITVLHMVITAPTIFKT
jgi:hypothetical protein